MEFDAPGVEKVLADALRGRLAKDSEVEGAAGEMLDECGPAELEEDATARAPVDVETEAGRDATTEKAGFVTGKADGIAKESGKLDFELDVLNVD